MQLTEATGRDSALRCPRRRAQRQATEKWPIYHVRSALPGGAAQRGIPAKPNFRQLHNPIIPCKSVENRYFHSMIVTATEMANDGKNILDHVIQGGETVEVQRHGKTVALIQPRIGATRSELVRLLRGRGFSDTDNQQLRQAMEKASEVIGYAGGN